MNFLGHDLAFWIAIVLATFVKVMTSPYGGFLRLLTMVVAAVFSAYTFTDPVLTWTQLNPESYKYAIAALLALTGEGVMRMLMGFSNDPARLITLWNQWRSGK